MLLASYVRVQALANAGALDRDKQIAELQQAKAGRAVLPAPMGRRRLLDAAANRADGRRLRPSGGSG